MEATSEAGAVNVPHRDITKTQRAEGVRCGLSRSARRIMSGPLSADAMGFKGRARSYYDHDIVRNVATLKFKRCL